MLVRPLMTNFKMTVRTEWTVFACNSFHSVWKSSCPWSCGDGGAGLGTDVPFPTRHSIGKKANFPPSWPVHWFLSCEQPDPAFGHAISQTRPSDWAYTYASAIWWAVSWTIVLSKVLKQNLTPNFWILLSSFCGQGGQLRILLYTLCMFSRCSCVWLCNPMDCSPSGSSVNGISRQEYWSRLPFHSPGDLPHPGIKPASPALQADSLPVSHRRDPLYMLLTSNCFYLEMHIGRIVFAQVKPKGLLNSY